MTFSQLNVSGTWAFEPARFIDERGFFQENFKKSLIESELGIQFEVKQVNQSLSNAGVVRGIHWADFPPGQAKYVTVQRGSIWDVVVDLRVGSPTLGLWDAIELSAENGKALLIGSGIGHGFLSLEDSTVVNYLCSEEFNKDHEHGLNPFDADLAIDFQVTANRFGIPNLLLSPKDSTANSFKHYRDLGLLPIVA